MDEHGEKPGLDLRTRLDLTKLELHRKTHELDLALDPEARQARKVIEPLAEALKPFLEDRSLPKILQLEAEGR